MTDKQQAVQLSKGKLKVSANNRFLTDQFDAPFFWMGDTAWELFHRLNKEEATYYFSVRSSQGFNVVQATILAELDGIRVPNAYGEIPLQNEDPTLPNEKYFEQVDWVINEAERFGIYIALLPTWADKVSKRYEWAKGPEIFDENTAYVFAKWLAQRYQQQRNIIWVLGGDRNPTENEIAIWNSMGNAIKDVIKDALITFHPQPMDGGSSSKWFHQQKWLSFNMLQTGHDKNTPVYDLISKDYGLSPVKPVINGEPTYEAHGLSFKHLENGYSSDAEVRKYAYWSVFAGAFGHTYGCHSVWQFYEKKWEAINFPLYEWKAALELAAARQMKYLRLLMELKPLSLCIPANEIIEQHKADDIENYITALRSSDETFAYVYSTTGQSFSIYTKCIKGSSLKYCWYNPKDGSSTIAYYCNKEILIAFNPPNKGYGNDWVLIIESEN